MITVNSECCSESKKCPKTESMSQIFVNDLIPGRILIFVPSWGFVHGRVRDRIRMEVLLKSCRSKKGGPLNLSYSHHDK
jgi:hypothetical protein